MKAGNGNITLIEFLIRKIYKKVFHSGSCRGRTRIDCIRSAPRNMIRLYRTRQSAVNSCPACREILLFDCSIVFLFLTSEFPVHQLLLRG